MHVITATRLRDFWQRHGDAKSPLRAWIRMMESRSYTSSHEVQRDFATASFVGGRRTVFNIGGNKFRLVVDMRYDMGRVYVRHVLTHVEYDDLIRDDQL